MGPIFSSGAWVQALKAQDETLG